MDIESFEDLLSVDGIFEVCIYESSPKEYEIFIYRDKYSKYHLRDSFGKKMLWSEIDTAVAYIYEIGFCGKIILYTARYHRTKEEKFKDLEFMAKAKTADEIRIAFDKMGQWLPKFKNE